MKGIILIDKLKATFCHLLISIFALAISAYFIFAIWYPGKFFDIAGGSGIFGIVAIVELVVGPCLTLVVYNKAKPLKELIIDYIVIGMVQISALTYGLYTAYHAKPYLLVFSVDRFELVRVIDLSEEVVPPLGTSFLKNGPKLVEAQLPTSIEERNNILFSAVEGKDIHLMPRYYVRYKASSILKSANSVSLLLDSGLIDKKHVPASCLNKCLWLPLVSHKSIWTVLLDSKTALPAFFVDLDPFPALEKRDSKLDSPKIEKH